MKIFRIITLLALLLTVATSTAQGQQPQRSREDYREEIESMKIGFFTRELGLDSQQSLQFWPLYNKYNAELRKILNSRRQLNRQVRERTATEQDLMDWIMVDQQIAELNLRYVPQFAEILGHAGTLKMFQTEDKFKQELLREANRRQGKNNASPPA